MGVKIGTDVQNPFNLLAGKDVSFYVIIGPDEGVP